MFKYKKRATDETSINDELSLIRKIVLSKNAKNFKKKSTFFTTIAHSVTQRALVEDRLADTTHRAPLGIYSEPLRGSADTLPALHCPSGNNKAPLAQRVTDCQSAFSPEGQIKKRPLDLRSGESPPGSSEVLNTKGLQNKQNLIFTRILPKTKFFLNKIYLKNLAKYTNIFSQSQIEWSSDSEDRLADTTLWGSSGSPEAQRKTTPSGPFLERQLSLPPALRLSDRDAQQPFSPCVNSGPLVRVAPSFQTEMEYMPTGAPLGQRAKRETVPTDKRLKREIEGNSFYESPLGITLDQSKTSSKQVMQKFHTEYSKQTEIHLITISLASANRIRQWAEKTLPNGKVVGEVINPETVHYKTLKPIKGGLFCERIFGPLKDHECACGKKFNIKNFLIPPKAAASLSLAAKGPLRKDENTLAPLGISLGQPELLEKYGLKAKSGAQKRYFCRICDVEYTYSIIRRTQLGYIRLATPATHVWFVKGIPSYISILLDIKRKHLQNIIYNSATLTLEHSLRGRQFVPNSPKSIFLSWQKIMQQQYPEKYGKTELNVFQPQKVPLQGNQLPSGLGGVPIHQSNNILPKGRKREGAPKELSGSAFSYPPDQRFALPLNGGQRWNICPRRIGNILPQSGPKGLASPALRDHNVGVREGNERSELLDRYVRVYNEQVILYKQNKKAFYKGTYDPLSLYSYPGGAPFGHILPEGGPKGQRRKRWHDQEAENTLKVAQRVPSGQRETDPFTQKKGWIRFVQSAAKIYAKGPLWGNDEPLCSLPKEPLWADIPLYYVSRFAGRNILRSKAAVQGQRRNILHMKEGAKCNITNQTRFYNKIYVSKQHDLTFLCFSLLNIINLTDTRKIYLLNLLNFLSSSISSTFNFYLTNTFFSSQNCLQLYTHSLLKVLTINTKKGYICPKGAQSAESLTPLWASLGKYCFSCGPLYLLCLKSNLINLAICYKDICQRGSKADVGPETYITNKSSIFINPPLQRGTKKRSAMPLAGHLEVAQSVAPEGQYIAATNLINTNLTRFLFFSPSLVFQQVLDTCVNKTWLFYTKSMSQKQRYNQGFRPAGLVPKGQTRYETLLMSTAVKTKMKKRNQKIRLSLLNYSFLKNYNLKHLQKQTTKILLMLTLNFRKLEVCLNLNPEGKRLSFSCPPEAKGPSGALTKELPLIADQSKLSILKKFNNLTNQKKIKLICQFDCCSYYFKQYYYLKRFNTSNTLATYYYFLTYPKKQIVQKLYKSLISDFTKIMQNSLISVNVKIVENASLLIQGDLQGNMLLSAFAPMKRVGSKGACMEGPFGYCFKLTKDYSYFKLSYIKQLLSLKTLTCFSLLPQRKDKPESISNFKQSLKINIFKIYAQGGLKLFSYPPGPEGQLPFVVSAIYAQRAESSRCPATPALRHILPKGRRLSSGSFGPHNCPSLSLSLGAKGFAIYREKAGPLESLKEIDIKKVFSETKNFISNNIYCLSHRELWEQEKDWQDFSYYYYSPSNIFDSLIPLYKNRNYDRALQEAPSVSNIYPKGGFQTKKLEKGALPTGRLNENNKVLYTSGMNIDTAFSGAGLIQKLLNEFSYTELKKIDKQNRVLLFEYNKYVKDLKNIIAGDDSQLLLTLQLKGSAINAQRGYYKACHIRDVLIRRTKLTRKIFNKLSPTAQTTGPLGPEGPTSPGGKLIDGLNMILTLLPVLPPVLRPVLKMSGQFTISDLNRLYQRIIYRNERLKKFLKDPALSSSFEMKYAQRLVQEAVDNLIQNGKSGVVPEKDARGRLLKSLSDILKGKQGRFRQYLLGKRVDYSGRSVIVVGPRLKLHECGIPKEMALVLYSPFLIKRILNEKLADTYLSAKKLIRKNPLLVSQLLREIMKECPVLLNRAPTLHRLGFQAFQPKLVDGKAILLHPLVCPAFNADFDGDQMAVHVPITFEARAEAWKLMLARNNLLSPATGEPLILPSQDMVLGCYYLTTNSAPLAQTARAPWAYIAQRGKYKKGYGMYFPTPQDVLKAYNQQLIHVHAVIWVSIKGYVENGNTLEQPLEMRLPLTNYKLNKYKNTKQKTVKNLKYVEIYKKCHNFLNLNSPSAHICLIGSGVPQRAPFGQYMHKGGNILPITECSIIHQIIKTTPGKIVFNIKLKNAMEKRPVLLSKYVTGTGFMKKRLLNTVAQRVTDCPAP